MNTETRVSFGDNLKRARKGKNLSMYKLAKLCDKTPQYFSALERGQCGLPSDNTISTICGVLDIDFNTVMKSINRLPQHMVDKILQNDELYNIVSNYSSVYNTNEVHDYD